MDVVLLDLGQLATVNRHQYRISDLILVEFQVGKLKTNLGVVYDW